MSVLFKSGLFFRIVCVSRHRACTGRILFSGFAANTTEKDKGENFKPNIITYSYISLLEILQNTIKKRKKVIPGVHADPCL